MTTRIGLSSIVAAVAFLAGSELIYPEAHAEVVRDGQIVAGKARAITTREALSFQAPFKIADLERKFGPWQPVHGGISIYPSADKKGMEFQFVWDVPKKPSEIRRISDYRIAFVVLARARDSEWVKVLWPAGMTIEQASEKNHRDLKEYNRRYPDAD